MIVTKGICLDKESLLRHGKTGFKLNEASTCFIQGAAPIVQKELQCVWYYVTEEGLCVCNSVTTHHLFCTVKLWFQRDPCLCI